VTELIAGLPVDVPRRRVPEGASAAPFSAWMTSEAQTDSGDRPRRLGRRRRPYSQLS
jgi:hypothetical protein